MNCKNKSFMTKKKAFTLIELLIVIAIIGILFIVLVSKVDFATDKAKATGVQTDFRSFQMAFDTVAKENAGFNTFGWDTGDANQNGKRDSYDEGDNGAGGGTAKNGIQDGAEVFTGHKVYDETFTKVFSLKKNGTGSYDRDALNRLETAINADLDPKLHITIKDDGEIVMANGAQDPWNKEYHGWYITNAETDGKDRGAIVLYSDGANNEFGSAHTIANGVVSVTVPNSNKDGKDDYSIVSCYTYVNGYGEVQNVTTGFSNNQSFLGDGSNNVDIENGDENNPELERPEGMNEYGFYFDVKYVGKLAGESVYLTLYSDGSAYMEVPSASYTEMLPAGSLTYDYLTINGESVDADGRGFIFEGVSMSLYTGPSNVMEPNKVTLSIGETVTVSYEDFIDNDETVNVNKIAYRWADDDVQDLGINNSYTCPYLEYTISSTDASLTFSGTETGVYTFYVYNDLGGGYEPHIYEVVFTIQ